MEKKSFSSGMKTASLNMIYRLKKSFLREMNGGGEEQRGKESDNQRWIGDLVLSRVTIHIWNAEVQMLMPPIRKHHKYVASQQSAE